MNPTTRPLPDDVRERMRARVMGGLEPAAPRRRTPLVLTAAATAALLGGVVALLATPEPAMPADPTDPPTSFGPRPQPALDLETARIDLDRCWDQVQASGKAHAYPHRSEWKPVFTTVEEGRQVTAARAEGMPLFCSTTLTSVSVSEPMPIENPPDWPTALFVSPDGVVAGIAPERQTLLQISVPGRSAAGGGVMGDGLFAVVVGPQDLRTVGPIEVSVDGGNYLPWDLRKALPPALTVVDKPEVAPDRETELGKLVARCVDQPGDGGPVFDAPSWRAGVLSPWYGEKRYLVIHNSRYATACEVGTDGTVRFPVNPPNYSDKGSVKRFIPVSVDPASDPAFVVGWVAPEVARMEIEAVDGRIIAPTISGETFAVGGQDFSHSDLETGELRLYDQAGALIHKGALREPV
jgi:hypothetical protein